MNILALIATIEIDEPLTRDEVCAAARAAVADYGEDYQDPNGAIGKACKYRYEDNPRENGEPRRCLIGEIVWRARGVQIIPTGPAIDSDSPSIASILHAQPDLVDGPSTRDLLRDMQRAQDRGKPWGEIVAGACGEAA